MHLLLVDGSGYIFRAFHALPQLTRKSDGLPVGSVKGFTEMLWKLMVDLKGEDEPTHMAVVFDFSAKTFRDEIYAEYKSHRPPMPEELVPQFPLTRNATRAYSIPSIELEGWEADDIIATYAMQAKAAGGKVTIASSDKDLMQLVEPDGSIQLLDTIPRPGQPPLRWIGADQVLEKFGVTPDKVIDVQALCGDAVDNVPGVPGIGVKTAAELINTWGDVETLLANVSSIKQPKRRQMLEENAELARISKKLVTLSSEVPVPIPLDGLVRQPLDAQTLFPFLKPIAFFAILKRLGPILDADPDQFEPDPELAAAPAKPIGFDNEAKEVARAARLSAEGRTESAAVLFATERLEKMRAIPIDREGYETISDAATLQRWIEAAQAQGYIAVDAESTGLDNQTADLVGLAFALAPGKAAYLPLNHVTGNGMFGSRVEGQMDEREALAMLKPLLEDRSILKVAHNVKYDLGLLLRYGIDLKPFDDTLLMSYVLDGVQYNTLSQLSAHWLNHTGIEIKELIGTGKNQKTFAEVDIPAAARYAAEDTDLTLRLWFALKPRLVAESQTALYETEERALAPVLARMEGRGIAVDRAILSRLTGDFTQRAAALEAQAY
jgi:DNA polymerase-1